MDLLTWKNAGLAALVVLGLASLVIVARLFRSGLGTYVKSRCSMEKRIRMTEAEIRERNRGMPLEEQLALIVAALEELLDLEGRPAGFAVQRLPRLVHFVTPQGLVRIEHAVRITTLRGNNRVLHGQDRWQVCLPEHAPLTFTDIVPLMRCLTQLVRGEYMTDEEPALPVLRRH